MQRIAFIGLGRMGGPCVRHLLARGHEVFIWARSPDKARPFTKLGAVLCATPAEAAARADILFTCVGAGPDVEALLFGPDGACHGARPGLICADLSTIAVDAARRLEARARRHGMFFLDVPVSGGVRAARNGTLALWAGGDEAAFNRARPALESLGTDIRYMGPAGAGQMTKACNQIIVAASLLAVGEAFRLCEATGADPAAVREALLHGGSAAGFVLENQGGRMLSPEPDTGFTIGLLSKDLGQVADLGREAGISLPLTAAVAARLQRAVVRGHGEEGTTRLFRIPDGPPGNETEDGARRGPTVRILCALPAHPRRAEHLSLPEGATVRHLRARLPDAAHPGHVLVVRNGECLADDSPLADGDELDLHAPVYGG